MSVQRNSTNRIELVETHNLALSLARLRSIQGSWGESAAKRALYHAVCMSGFLSIENKAKLRIALELP